MERHQRLNWIATLSPTMMGIVVGLGVFLPAALVSSLLYINGTEAIHEEIRGNLKRVAKTAALLVDPELHKTFHDPSQESTPEYERAIAPMRAFIEADSSFKYVYTYVELNGEIRFVLDPTPEGDSDHDGVDDKSHIMEVYDEDGLESMQRAAREHIATADPGLATDQWGTFISGYAPIFDKDGKYVASIGVDVAADKYAARLAQMRRAGIVAGVVALVVAVVVGSAASLFQKRRREWWDDQEASRAALQDFAASLDAANAQLRFASRRFESLFNLVPVACFTFDKNGTIYEWNREGERLAGVAAHEVVQQTVYETVVGPENHAMFRTMIEEVFSGRPTLDREWTDVARNGQRFTVVLNSFPLYSPDGTVTGGIVACADITTHKLLQRQNERQLSEIQRAYTELHSSRNDLTSTNLALSAANERLKLLASVDSLTGIANRRTVFEALGKAMSIAVRTNRPLSILMVDIDHFKALNDTHGHIAGDSMLKSVASHLTGALRNGDEVGRYGGEEFLIVLPDTDADEARHVAERIRAQIADSVSDGVNATVSLGASTLGKRHATIEQFIELADRALYEAKRSGRNRVVHSSDLTEGAA
jgi:diguanylate cyclase (GGDEF)-like protein/PAS domain S-box-containing protein